MKTIKNLCLTLVIIANMVACENLIEGPEDEPDSGDGTVVVTSLSEIQKTVFTPSCAIAGCHNGLNDPNLTDGESYISLVNAPSLEQPSMVRVRPGDSENSLLIRKLRGLGTARMPPVPRPALAQSTIDSIAAWIDRGALNN